jgi:hypothetical protein
MSTFTPSENYSLFKKSFSNGKGYVYYTENGMKMVIFAIPAKAGIQTRDVSYWIPACTGMTGKNVQFVPVCSIFSQKDARAMLHNSPKLPLSL